MAKHSVAGQAKVKAFNQQLAEMHLLLNQVQEEYQRVEADAKVAWDTFIGARDRRDAEVITLAKARLEELRHCGPQPSGGAEPVHRLGGANVTVPSENGQVAATPTAVVKTEPPRWYSQLHHRSEEVQPDTLRNLTECPPLTGEWLMMAKLKQWSTMLLMSDPALCFTYQQNSSQTSSSASWEQKHGRPFLGTLRYPWTTSFRCR